MVDAKLHPLLELPTVLIKAAAIGTCEQQTKGPQASVLKCHQLKMIIWPSSNYLPQVQAGVQGVAPHGGRPRGAGAGRLPRRQLARPRLQLPPRHAQRRRRLLLHRGDVLQECPLP